MSQISQKDCVVATVKSVLGTRYNAATPTKTTATTADITKIREAVFQQIQSGAVAYSKDANNAAELKKYVASLCSDHMSRAKELNGGVAKAKNPNPTPRVGGGSKKAPKVSDAVIVSLNQLAALYPADSDAYKEIQSKIAIRQTELMTKKTPVTAVSPQQENLDPELQAIIAGL